MSDNRQRYYTLQKGEPVEKGVKTRVYPLFVRRCGFRV